MSTDVDANVPPPAADPPKRRRGLQTGTRSLLVLVACVGVILWAWRYYWENSDPVRVQAREIQERAIRNLKASQPEDRIGAIQDLQRLGAGDPTVGIPSLIAALQDPVQEVRDTAALGLVDLCLMAVKNKSTGEPVHAALRALIDRLQDFDQNTRLFSIKYLGEIGGRLSRAGVEPKSVRKTISTLVVLLREDDPAIRSASVTALRNIAALPGSAVDDAIDSKALNESLTGMLADPDEGVRCAAVNALTVRPWISPPKELARAFKDPSPRVRRTTAQSLMLCRSGLDPFVPLLLDLAEHDPAPDVRAQCLRTLTSHAASTPGITAAVVPILIAGLKSPDPGARSSSALVLATLGPDARPAIPQLLLVLNEPMAADVISVISPRGTFDPGCAAAQALGKITPGTPDEKPVIAGLTEAIRSAPIQRRGWAAVALSRFGPTAVEAIPVLIQLLKEALPDDRFERASSAALALGKIAPGSPLASEAVEALRLALPMKGQDLRNMAIKVLTEFGPAAAPALPDLRALKNDRDADTRKRVSDAMLAIEK